MTQATIANQVLHRQRSQLRFEPLEVEDALVDEHCAELRMRQVERKLVEFAQIEELGRVLHGSVAKRQRLLRNEPAYTYMYKYMYTCTCIFLNFPLNAVLKCTRIHVQRYILSIYLPW